MLSLEMSDGEFQLFRDFIYEKSGINYTINKKVILQNRIRRRLRELNLESYTSYFNFVKTKSMDHEEIVKLFDEVTTNETSFFRHARQFVALEKMVIPEIIQNKRSAEINIWSSAASMGKEAYTISMILKSMPKMYNYNINILGTDLNNKVLDMAKFGEYSLKDIKDIPEMYERFIIKDTEKGILIIKDELKNLVNFKRFNLKDSFFSIPFMDVIFCRNVFIYFEKITQAEIVEKFYNKLNPGGFLILGHSETLNGISEKFKYRKFNDENLMVYQKK